MGRVRGGAAVKPQHDLAGYGNYVVAFRFFAWMQAQRTFPMPEQVIARFGCGRATAHRWLNAYEEATGMQRPRRNCIGAVRVECAA